MDIKQQIEDYINSQSNLKRSDMQELHRLMVSLNPSVRLWFLDGRNEEGKIVSNPNIGYGLQIMQYANGTTREFYQVGLSANTVGISVYIMGIKDKKYLSDNYADRLGKASVSGYCIKFKSLQDINIAVLEEIMRFGLSPR